MNIQCAVITNCVGHLMLRLQTSNNLHLGSKIINNSSDLEVTGESHKFKPADLVGRV